jgi:hypothetical protein
MGGGRGLRLEVGKFERPILAGERTRFAGLVLMVR